MIVLEFHYRDTFTKAMCLLKDTDLEISVEESKKSSQPHRVWFFEKDMRTALQKEAFQLARTFETEDHTRHKNSRDSYLSRPL